MAGRVRETLVTSIAVDGLNEEAFRRLIESRLRQGKAALVVERLRGLLEPYAGQEGILPDRFLTVKAEDLVLTGWEGLVDALRRHDKPDRPVTALSIAFGWPGENAPEPDDQGRLAPHIEISYFTDDAFPFSRSGREDLLEGYSYHGCTWGDDCEATDAALSLDGIDDLHGALASLEARLLASDEPDAEEIRAGSLGSCLLSALLFQAVGDRIARDDLPRPLCVMAGSNGVYPYFDAPVVGMPDEACKAAEASQAVPGPRYSSLVMTGIPRAKKRAVLVLDEQQAEMENRIAKLRGMGQTGDENGPVPHEALPEMPALILPDPAIGAASRSPLLAKKTVRPDWDFRDMLSPHQPVRPSAELPQPKPDVSFDQSASAAGQEPPMGPGFSLLETGLQERLQALISPTVPREAKNSEPAPSNPESLAEPAWLSSHCWPDDDDTVPHLETARSETDTAQRLPTMWARLREWLRWLS
jgi:hypothetical protein